MARKFVPLTLDLIDEGHFVEAVNQALGKTMADLVQHVKEYGKDAAQGAKAKLQVVITLKFDGKDESDYSVRTDLKAVYPARPPSVSKAVDELKDDGTPALFVRKTGSTRDEPQQAILCTQKGELVDPQTGEVLPAKATTAKAK